MPQDPQNPQNPNQEITLEEWERRTFERFGVPENLRKSILGQESANGTKLTSPTGVKGRYMVTKATAKKHGYNRDDPWEQPIAAAMEMRELYDGIKKRSPQFSDKQAWLGASAEYYYGANAFDSDGNLSGQSRDGFSTPAKYATSIAERWSSFDRGEEPQIQPTRVTPQAAAPTRPTGALWDDIYQFENLKEQGFQREATEIANRIKRQHGKTMEVGTGAGGWPYVKPRASSGMSYTLDDVFRQDPAALEESKQQLLAQQREEFSRRPMTDQIVERGVEALARGGGDLSKMARQTIAAAKALDKKIGTPVPIFSGIGAVVPDSVMESWREGDERTMRMLEERRQGRPSSLASDIGEGIVQGIPTAAAAIGGGILTGGGVPAAMAIGGGMGAASADWEDPDRALTQTAFNAVLPVVGGKVGGKVGEAVASRLARPAAQAGARAGGELLGGATGNVMGSAADQLAFEGQLDPRELTKQAVIGAALNVPSAVNVGRAGRAVSPYAAPDPTIVEQAAQSPSRGQMTVTRRGQPGRVVFGSTPEEATLRVAERSADSGLRILQDYTNRVAEIEQAIPDGPERQVALDAARQEYQARRRGELSDDVRANLARPNITARPVAEPAPETPTERLPVRVAPEDTRVTAELPRQTAAIPRPALDTQPTRGLTPEEMQPERPTQPVAEDAPPEPITPAPAPKSKAEQSAQRALAGVRIAQKYRQQADAAKAEGDLAAAQDAYDTEVKALKDALSLLPKTEIGKRAQLNNAIAQAQRLRDSAGTQLKGQKGKAVAPAVDEAPTAEVPRQASTPLLEQINNPEGLPPVGEGPAPAQFPVSFERLAERQQRQREEGESRARGKATDTLSPIEYLKRKTGREGIRVSDEGEARILGAKEAGIVGLTNRNSKWTLADAQAMLDEGGFKLDDGRRFTDPSVTENDVLTFLGASGKEGKLNTVGLDRQLADEEAAYYARFEDEGAVQPAPESAPLPDSAPPPPPARRTPPAPSVPRRPGQRVSTPAPRKPSETGALEDFGDFFDQMKAEEPQAPGDRRREPRTSGLLETSTPARPVTQEIQIPPARNPKTDFASREDARQGHFDTLTDSELVAEITRMEGVRNDAVRGRSGLSPEDVEANNFDLKIAVEQQKERGRIQRAQRREPGERIAPRTPARASKKPEAQDKKAEEPPTVTHSNPDLDRKPILAETGRGTVIVPNPKNKTGISEIKDRSGDPTEYKFSSTQVDLPKEVGDKLIEFGKRIPRADLTDDGRETTPHVTVKFGLHGSDPKFAREALAGEGPIQVKFGKVSLFETNPDFDVIKVDIDSPDLHRLNEKVAKSQPVTDTHPTYQPHATIAYVKKGKGAKYVGDNFLEGQTTTLDRVLFSGRDGQKVEIPLKGAPRSSGPIPAEAMPELQTPNAPPSPLKKELPSRGRQSYAIPDKAMPELQNRPRRSQGHIMGMGPGSLQGLFEGRAKQRSGQQPLFENKPKIDAKRVGREVVNALTLPRTLMASADLSAPLRQGAILTLPPTQWGRAAKSGLRMLQALKNTEYARLTTEMNSHPDAKIGKDSGLYMSTDTSKGDALAAKEEAFISDWAGKIPIVKQVVGRSEQAYKTYLDSIRLETFRKYKRVIDSDKSLSFDERVKAYKAAADWINIATGRGSLGKTLDKAMPALSAVFFAPRYTASRIQALNPATYLKNLDSAGGRAVLKQQMSDLVQFAGMTAATLAIAKAAGASISLDPEDSDFLKFRFGNTRFDTMAGLQQIMRLFYRTGKDFAAATRGEKPAAGQSALEIAAKFGRSKLAPVPSFFVDMIQRKDFIGRKFDLDRAVVERMAPIMWKDFIEAYQREGLGGAAKQAPGFFGVGVQDYEKRPGTVNFGGKLDTELRKHGLDYSNVDEMPGDTEKSHKARADKVERWMKQYGGTLISSPRYRSMKPAQQKEAIQNLRRRIGTEANQKVPNFSKFAAWEIINSTIESERARPERNRRKIVVAPD